MLDNRFFRLLGVAAIACSVLVAVSASDASARIEPGDISILQADGGNRQMEIEYNPDRDEYLAVWRTDATFGTTQIFSAVLDSDGRPEGPPTLLADNVGRADDSNYISAATGFRPDVSYNPVTKQYLVTIMRDFVDNRGSGILGILVSDTGTKAPGEIRINNEQGSTIGCTSFFPDAVADPATGGWKIVYARQDGVCEGLADFNWTAVIQSLSPTLVRGPSVYVPFRSMTQITPRVAYNPVTGTFLVATTSHAGLYEIPDGHAHIYDSALAPVGGSIDVAHTDYIGNDIGGYTVPIADPVTGNWVVFYNSNSYSSIWANEFTATGAAIGDGPMPYRGDISAVSAIGDGTILVSNYQGALQQVRRDGSEIHHIDSSLLPGNVGVPNATVANGDPVDRRAVSIGLDPATYDTATRGLSLFAPGPLPLSPARLLDTRDGADFTTIDGLFEGGGKQAAGSTLQLQVAGRGGVPTDAEAVLLNIAAAGTSATGFVTAYPCDATTRPTTSNLNYPAGGASSAAAIAKVSATGTVCLYTSADAHLIVDVNGDVPSGGSVSPLVPVRLLETRTGPTAATTDGLSQGIGRVAAGSVTTLAVAGRGGVDADADAVLVNVTAIKPDVRAFLTVYPCDADQPTAASLNAPAGGNVNNLVTAKVGAAGTICVYSSAATDLVVDVAAFVPHDGGLLSIVPARLFESRSTPDSVTIDGEGQGGGRVEAGVDTRIRVSRGDVPLDASGVMLNVAAINPDTAGYITVFPASFPTPCSETRPTAANVNFAAGEVVSNAVFVKTGDISGSGYVCVFSSTGTDLAVDVVAYTVDT